MSLDDVELVGTSDDGRTGLDENLSYTVGRPTYAKLFSSKARGLTTCAALLCGPESLVSDAQVAAMDNGWDVHKETFLF